MIADPENLWAWARLQAGDPAGAAAKGSLSIVLAAAGDRIRALEEELRVITESHNVVVADAARLRADYDALAEAMAQLGEDSEAEVARLRKALTFYADRENYEAHHYDADGWHAAEVIEDRGARARAALGEGT